MGGCPELGPGWERVVLGGHCNNLIAPQVRVFTFSVGQHNYDVTPLQWMACTNKGTTGFHYRGICLLCPSANYPSICPTVCSLTVCLSFHTYPLSIALSICWAVLLVHLTKRLTAHLAVCPLSICLPAFFLLLHLFADQSISLGIRVISCY